MEVVDERTGYSAGTLVNLSADGLMLSSSEPIESDSFFQFGLTIPDAIAGEYVLSVDARSVWCRHNLHTNEYDTGFRMINLDEQTENVITEAMNDYLFQD
jgi:hypothetical protein